MIKQYKHRRWEEAAVSPQVQHHHNRCLCRPCCLRKLGRPKGLTDIPHLECPNASPWLLDRITSTTSSYFLSHSLQFSPALSNSLLFNIIFLRIFAYVPSKSSSIGLHEAFSIIFPPSSCPSEGEPSAGLCGARGTGEQELQGCGGGRIDRETSLGKRSLDWFTVEL